jgi:hypothetical protein
MDQTMKSFFVKKDIVSRNSGGLVSRGTVDEKVYKPEGIQMLRVPKARLMSAFVGRKNREINGQLRHSKPLLNELDCLMECDRVIQTRGLKGAIEETGGRNNIQTPQLTPKKMLVSGPTSPVRQRQCSVDSPKMAYQGYERSAASDGALSSREVGQDMQRLVYSKLNSKY